MLVLVMGALLPRIDPAPNCSLLELLRARCGGGVHLMEGLFLRKGLKARGVKGMGGKGGFNKNNSGI